MKILNTTDCLCNYLKSQNKKEIQIVTAFASGTESILKTLIDNKNKVEILVGTINAFTSPKFIEYCKEKSSDDLKLFVDFRYDSSIHWKLYLISPNIVVIGSANFTQKGVSLLRDTCVVINNADLYKNYKNEIKDLLENKGVINVKSKSFDLAFTTYCVKHQQAQAGLARLNQYSTLEEWLSDENNQQIPLFIWGRRHTKKEKEEAARLLREDTAKEDVPTLGEFFTYSEENEFPFRQGDVVLCAGRLGGYIDFYTFDRIIFSDGTYFIYSYKQKNPPNPFKINDFLKKQLKQKITELYRQAVLLEQDVTHIDRDVLLEISNSS